jgi:hypothetical protein
VSQIETSPRDSRVLDLLRNELAAFDLELSSPAKVVKQVAARIGELQDTNVTVVEALRQIWWPIEFTYALSVDEERPLTEAENEQLREAVTALETLIGPGT